jgi:hypothetical protein
MRFAPIATNDLLQRVQWLAAAGFARKLQHQLLCIRSTDHFKPDGSDAAASAILSASFTAGCGSSHRRLEYVPCHTPTIFRP